MAGTTDEAKEEGGSGNERPEDEREEEHRREVESGRRSGRTSTGKIDQPTEEEKRDDREEPPDPEAPDAPPAIVAAAKVQDLLYYVIAVMLVGLAIAALIRLGADFFTLDEPFAKRVTRAVNGVLFVVIVMELLRTILAQLEDAAFQLKPFLIVGIISAVRHILTVGAELSLAEDDPSHLLHRADVELGVNALVVLVLVIGLVLVRKTE